MESKGQPDRDQEQQESQSRSSEGITASPTTSKPRSGLKFIGLVLLGLLLGLPILYVLGSGPAHRLFLDGTLSFHTYKAMYEPLVEWVEAHPPTDKPFYWYREFCSKQRPPPAGR
jgi:hypothetical protein